MRYEDVRQKYTRHGKPWTDENKLFVVGEQMAFEWEKDFIAMKQAIDYLLNGGVQGKNFAFNVLVKRISESSCPSNLKEHLRTKENCPLKDKCKCSQPVSAK